MKMLNASIYIFIILNFVKKGILDIHLITATDICMKNVIDSFLRRTLLRKIIETLKALIIIKVLIITITLLNLVSKGLSFYYSVNL